VLGDPERPVIEKRIESIVKEGQRFERVVVTRDEALAMFQENKFKVRCQPQLLLLLQHMQQELGSRQA
jgi:threonyl-tRNA synthetase